MKRCYFNIPFGHLGGSQFGNFNATERKILGTIGWRLARRTVIPARCEGANVKLESEHGTPGAIEPLSGGGDYVSTPWMWETRSLTHLHVVMLG